MKFAADLHLHSKYSRAVSQGMILPQMAKWAKFKGINVIATGDFTHPFWFEQLKTELEDAGNGLYRLRKTTNVKRLMPDQASDVSHLALSEQEVYFLLSCEVASIYSQDKKLRKIHNLFFFPSLVTVEKFNKELLKRGANLRADGRAVVGITARNLVEIALACTDQALIIPAHAWTPWFSVFGAFSGFDSLEECFGDMDKYVYGIETGLSSDPAMNWRIGELTDRAILSFSDAHSLEKMGREATVFEAEEISYNAIFQAIQQSSKPKIAFTIEFYPEEGKYHFTGHRNCNVSLSPQETAQQGTICPVCGRNLTIGVIHRVEQLAEKMSNCQLQISNGVRWVKTDENRPPYVSLVPLMEILAEALGAGEKSQKVISQYLVLVKACGNEFNVLLKADLDQITKITNLRVVEGIAKVRSGDIVVEPGYDGKFGVVKIWQKEAGEIKKEKSEAQLNLFVQ